MLYSQCQMKKTCLFHCLANNAPYVEAAAQRACSRCTSQYGSLVGGVGITEMEHFEIMFGIRMAIYARVYADQAGVFRAIRRLPATFEGRCMSIMADESYNHANLMTSPLVQCNCYNDFFMYKAAMPRKCTNCGKELKHCCRLMRHLAHSPMS